MAKCVTWNGIYDCAEWKAKEKVKEHMGLLLKGEKEGEEEESGDQR